MTGKLSGLKTQTRNANKHTPNGMGALRTSIGKWGLADGITVAADGESISGSARLETLAEIMPDVKVVVVDTDGNTLLVNRRTDIPNANTKEAQSLSAAVNIVQHMDYAPDGDILAMIAADDDEVARLIGQDDDSEDAVAQALADALLNSGPEQLIEHSESLTPREYLRVLISVPLDSAIDARAIIEQVASIEGAQVDYGAN